MVENSSKPPIVALYLRVSTSQQDHEMQRESLLKKAEEFGAKIFHEYTDTITGSTSASERKYANDVIEDARAGKFQTLLVWRIDRIARDEEYGLNYLRRIEETGCKIKFLTNSSIDTPESYTEQAASMIKTMRVMLLTGARMEHDSIKARTRASKTRDIKANKWPANGHIPDGYLLDKETGGLLPNPIRMPIIQRIFSLYIDDGLTVREIKDLLNKEGIPSYKGRPWGKDTIQDKLSNPVYRGELPINGKKLGPIHVFTCKPIISDERFAEAQQRKKERVDRSKRKPGRELIFRPYIWCARCGHDLHSITSGANTEYENYHYGFRKPTGEIKYKKRCSDGCGRISEIKLVEALYKKFSPLFRYSVLGKDEMVSFFETDDGTESMRVRQETELTGLKAEHNDLYVQAERARDMYQSQLSDKKSLEQRLSKINQRLRVVGERIRLIEQGFVGQEEEEKTIEKLKTWVEEAKKMLDYSEKTGHVYLLEQPEETEYKKKRELIVQLLRFIKRIDVDFPSRELMVYTKAPKYLDGEVIFESDPVIKRGRPPGGGSQENKAPLLVASSNSSSLYKSKTRRSAGF